MDAFFSVLERLGAPLAAAVAAVIGSYLVFKPAMAGRRMEARKLAADERKSDLDSAAAERREIREDMQMLLREMRADQARMQERDERNQAKIDALTAKSNTLLQTVSEMKVYIVRLSEFIRGLGHEPPKPPREW